MAVTLSRIGPDRKRKRAPGGVVFASSSATVRFLFPGIGEATIIKAKPPTLVKVKPLPLDILGTVGFESTSANYEWASPEDWQYVPDPEKLKSSIIQLLEQNPRLDDEQIGDEVGITPFEASFLLRELEAAGQIRRV